MKKTKVSFKPPDGTGNRIAVERNIYLNKSTGNYLVALYYGTAGGKAHRIFQTCNTLPEARRLLQEHERERARGQRSANTRVTVEECAQQYIDNKPLAATTKEGYSNILRRISARGLGQKRMARIKKIDIQEYVDNLVQEGKLKAKTINGDRTFLIAVFNYAKDYEYVSENVAERVHKVQEDVFEGSAYSKEELRDLMLAIEQTGDLRLKTFVLLGVGQGMRRSEISGLKWEHIDFENNVIHIEEIRTAIRGEVITKEPKTKNSRRTIAMCQTVKDSLLAYRIQQEERGHLGEYVIIGRTGNPLRPNQMGNRFKSFLEANGLRHIRVHDLRHTFCTLGIDSGTGFAHMAKFMGHSSTRVTEKIYTHLTDTSTVEVARTIQGVLTEIME